MHIKQTSWKSKNGQTYHSAFLCRTYREGGRIKTEYIANLKGCSSEEIAAMRLALKNPINFVSGSKKGYLDSTENLIQSSENLDCQQGKSCGSVLAIVQLANRIGLTQALGSEREGKLALFQVISRIINQGSRLSSIRQNKCYALAEALQIREDFCEDDLYTNLKWLTEQQSVIEDALFKKRYGHNKPNLYLYDVTSSYLEGQSNQLAQYGYNRDKKSGKMQIVVGMLTDQDGKVICTEVFSGNTSDIKTFGSQVKKVAERFNCERVTFVGDRGMIKSGQVSELHEHGFNFITGITHPQIEKLLRDRVISMELFDNEVCEVSHNGQRLILRRNPYRAEELAKNRRDKLSTLENLIERKNKYLLEHPRAKPEVAIKAIVSKINKLNLEDWVTIEVIDRSIEISCNPAALAECSRLDGCYVLVSDLPVDSATADVIHSRYKDLSKVERCFRISKTGHLELRPIYVQTEASTRGHVFVVMLAYNLRQLLEEAWQDLDITVEEGLRALSQICMTEINIGGQNIELIPQPSKQNKELLDKLGITLPEALPKTTANVGTRKKLSRKT